MHSPFRKRLHFLLKPSLSIRRFAGFARPFIVQYAKTLTDFRNFIVIIGIID